jgi:hypothetical protein
LPEHRQHPRRSVHPFTAWAFPGKPQTEAHCRDISLGGCFLEVESPPAFGTPVMVFVELPGLTDDEGRPTPAVITATVRWTTPHGMGVQFGPMGVRETHALIQMLSG